MVESISGSAPYSYMDQLSGTASKPVAPAPATATSSVTNSSNAVTGKISPKLGLSPDIISLLQGDSKGGLANQLLDSDNIYQVSGLVSQLLDGSSANPINGDISKILGGNGGFVSHSKNPYIDMLSVSVQTDLYKSAYQGAINRLGKIF